MDKSRARKCGASPDGAELSYAIEAVITVDERGQLVLPKETRARAGIRPGDKLALVGWRKGDRVCCLSLIRADDMTQMVGQLMNSLMNSQGGD
ncbi:MAG: HgcAB-associated protein [Thermoguttaceae bacterium]|nr:HgcAB-associated protein [Thermoguttaceae bacterium]